MSTLKRDKPLEAYSLLDPKVHACPYEFFQRLRRSGLGRDANLGRVSEVEFARALGQLYGLDRQRRRNCSPICGAGTLAS